MTLRTTMAVLTGYCLGQLPDDGPAWAGLHLLTALVLFAALVRAVRRETA